MCLFMMVCVNTGNGFKNFLDFQADFSYRQVYWLILKLSDFIFYIIVTARLVGRFLSSDGCIWISRKLRNLKDATTQIT